MAVWFGTKIVGYPNNGVAYNPKKSSVASIGMIIIIMTIIIQS
jgi:hypothetical protein